MTAPSKYTRNRDFSDYEAAHPNDNYSGTDLDAEFDELKTVTDAIIDNLGLIQRSDGAIKNGVVTPDSLSSATLALMTAADGDPTGDWVTATAYAVKDLASYQGNVYICVIAHTSGTFATDLAAGKWMVFSLGVALTETPMVDFFNGTGSSQAYTLSQTFGTDERAIEVYVKEDGNYFELVPYTGYTLSGSSLTINAASGTNNIMVKTPNAAVAASANAAAASASAAATSESNAATSATAAASSASAASTSASTASTQATNAATSASAASTSATAAATSATNAATSATAAAASKTAAETAETNAETAETNAETAQAAAEAAQSAAATSASAASTSATAAATSATAAANSATSAAGSATTATTQAGNASTSATNAASSASAAAVSAAAAASTLASALWRGIVRKTTADSPYTVTSSDNGKLIVVDSSSGAVTINLPQISGLTLPFNVGIQLDAGSNAITINRAGTDTIDGSTSISITSAGEGRELMADSAPSPDEWEVITFGFSPVTAGAGIDVTGAQVSLNVNGLTEDTAPDESNDFILTYDASATAAKKVTLLNLLKRINSLTEDTTPDEANDFLLSYDASATTVKKVKPQNLDIAASQVNSGVLGTARLASSGTANSSSYLRGDQTWAAVPTVTVATVQTTTSGTSAKDFTGIPAGVTRIEILVNGVSTNSTDDFVIQIGDSGGIETTGYDVYSGRMGSTEGSQSAGGGTGGTGFTIDNDASTAQTWAIVTLLLLEASSNTWMASWVYSGSGIFFGSGCGKKSLSATLDRVRFSSSAGGTWDAGSVTIQYS